MLTNGEMMKRFEDVIRDDALTPDDKIKTLRVEFAGHKLNFPERTLNFANLDEMNKCLIIDYMSGQMTMDDMKEKFDRSESSIYRIAAKMTPWYYDVYLKEKETK